jgi:uracil-DNA glycosylase
METKWTGPHESWNRMKCWDYYFKEILPELQKMEEAGRIVLPAASQRFASYELGKDDIKVIIVGQDPYPTKGHAHGLAFSCLPHITKLPPTLCNIFKEAAEDLGEDFGRPRNGDLRKWASNGVFLYNTALTVEEGKPKSHIKLWEKFTYETLRTVSESEQAIAWMLWGKQAQQYEALVPSHHLKLCAGHPSPLGVRNFTGCKHFSQARDWLELPKDFWKL